VRAELGLVGRHVDIDRAVALAALAAEAQIERVLDRVVAPIARDGAAMHHLEQEVRAAARRMLLLACCEVARAHDAVFGVVPAAFADADATDRGALPIAFGWKGEAGLEARRAVFRAEAQI
jgi:hypothetical protein